MHLTESCYKQDLCVYVYAPCSNICYDATGTINDKKLLGLRVWQISLWWKKVWQIHPELQLCMDNRMIFATDKSSLAKIAQFAKFALNFSSTNFLLFTVTAGNMRHVCYVLISIVTACLQQRVLLISVILIIFY